MEVGYQSGFHPLVLWHYVRSSPTNCFQLLELLQLSDSLSFSSDHGFLQVELTQASSTVMGVPPSSDEVENPSSFLRAYNTRSDNDSYEEEEEIIKNQNALVLKSLDIITKAPKLPHPIGVVRGVGQIGCSVLLSFSFIKLCFCWL